MSTYLIDFENVKSGGLTGIDSIRKEDSVHLFWSTRENKISIEMMELIRSSESEIVMHKAVTGERDALDHQLCSYLGFLAGAQGETDFVIVSNDKAYDHLIEFWKKMNDKVKISRVSDIGKAVELLRRQEAAKEAAKRAAEKAAQEKAVQVEMVQEAAEEVIPVLKEAAENVEKTDIAEKTDKVEKLDKIEREAAEETRHGRNARRRERGSRYLKNGRQGRGERRNTYTEEAAPAQVREQAEYETEVKAAEPKTIEVKTAEPVEEKSVIHSAAYVVSGIRSGILVESGFTADGILDKKEEKKPESAAEEEKSAEEQVVSAKEAEKPAKEKEKAVAEAAKTEPVPVEEEISVEKETSAASEKSAEPEIPVKEEPDLEGEISIQEEISDVSEQEEPVSESENLQEEKIEKKTRTRSSKTAGRTRKSRTAKTKEHTPKAPATAADVVEKCGEAAHAEWTADVVRLINESNDLKELYASIVKLLGQENGRRVYRAIKVLK